MFNEPPPSYAQLLRNRAWALSKEHFAWIYPLLTAGVLFLVQWIFAGWEEAADAVIASLYSAGAAVIVAGIVFAVNVFRAAAALHGEQQDTIERLERELYEARAALEANRRNGTLADALKALDQRGLHELWAPKTFVLPRWFDEVDAWEKDVLEAITTHGGTENDLHHVRDLGNIFRPERYNADREIDRRLKMIDIRRQRIKDVIKRYDPDAY